MRFDFQQPHGPGNMDHSFALASNSPRRALGVGSRPRRGRRVEIPRTSRSKHQRVSSRRYAAVRRFVDVPVRPRRDLHAGLVVDPTSRTVFVASGASGEVLRVGADTGRFARSARGGGGAGVPEYPAFSSRLPAFEYSVYECATWTVFASGLETPTGLALADGVLYVAEWETGDISAFEISSGRRLRVFATGRRNALHGLAAAGNALYAIDGRADELLKIDAAPCERTGDAAADAAAAAAPAFVDLYGVGCNVTEGALVNASLFEQVHGDTGYLGDDMGDEASAIALGNRTDCENLNLDAFLLSGYFAHACLPDGLCDVGGAATALRGRGYACDNELHVDVAGLREENATLRRGVTYRVTVNAAGSPLVVTDAETGETLFAPGVDVGPAYFVVDDSTPDALVLGGREVAVTPLRPPSRGSSSSNDALEDLLLWVLPLALGAVALAAYGLFRRGTRTAPDWSAKEEEKEEREEIVLAVAADDEKL